MSLAKIDRHDRNRILYLNNLAASQRKLYELTSGSEAAGVYRSLLNLTLHDLDCAVDQALKRAA